MLRNTIRVGNSHIQGGEGFRIWGNTSFLYFGCSGARGPRATFLRGTRSPRYVSAGHGVPALHFCGARGPRATFLRGTGSPRYVSAGHGVPALRFCGARGPRATFLRGTGSPRYVSAGHGVPVLQLFQLFHRLIFSCIHKIEEANAHFICGFVSPTDGDRWVVWVGWVLDRIVKVRNK